MILLIIPVIFILFAVIYAYVTKRQNNPLDNMSSWPYERMQQLLNPLELTFYKVLKEKLDPGMIILPKVRMQNLVYVSQNTKLNNRLQEKLSDKYLDFAICDANDLSLICVIEFDDDVDTVKNTKDIEELEKILEGAYLYLYRYTPQYEYETQDFQIINELYAHMKSS